MNSGDFVAGSERFQQVPVSLSFQVVLAPIVALCIYLGVCLLTFQFMSVGNGVVDGKLVPNSDHWPVAEEIMAGKGLTNFFYAPGFSIYIIAAHKASEVWGKSYYFWRLVQDSVSTAVSAMILMALMRGLSGSLLAGWGAVLALLYNVTYSAGTSADLAMASFMPWYLASLLLLVRAIQSNSKSVLGVDLFAILSGSALAVSGFIRPDILLLLPFLGTMFCLIRTVTPNNKGLAEQQHIRHVFRTALLGFLIILLPWVLYSSFRSGNLVIYSTGFAHGHIDGMIRFPDNPVSEAFLKQWPEMNRAHIRQNQGSKPKTLEHREKPLSEVIKLHWHLLQVFPLDYLKLWAGKLWRPWYASDSSKWNLLLGAQSIVILLMFIPGLYIWVCRRGWDLGFTMGVSVIAYFWLLNLSVSTLNRYMPPVYPFLGMFIGFGAQTLWYQGRLRRQERPMRDTTAD